jgi:hypothetical protein
MVLGMLNAGALVFSLFELTTMPLAVVEDSRVANYQRGWEDGRSMAEEG